MGNRHYRLTKTTIFETVAPWNCGLMEWKHFIEANIPRLIRMFADHLEADCDEVTQVYFESVDGFSVSASEARLRKGTTLSWNDVQIIHQVAGHVLSLIGGAVFGEGSLRHDFTIITESDRVFTWKHTFYHTSIV